MRVVNDIREVFADVNRTVEQTDHSSVLMWLIQECRANSAAAFAGERSIDGAAWPTWWYARPSVLDSMGPSKPTLEVTGALKNSVIGSGGGHIESVTGNEMTWGTALDYAAIHQEGGPMVVDTLLVNRGRTDGRDVGEILDIPARPFIGLLESQVDEFSNRVADHLVDELLRSA